MNQQIRRLGVFILLCYVALFARLNWLQLGQKSSYDANPLNQRQVLRDFAQPRGVIQSVDGVVLAESVPSTDQYKLQRRYPTADLFAHVTGSFSKDFGSTGIEKQYNDILAGQTTAQQYKSFSDLFVDRTRVGDVTLTVDSVVQQAAKAALGDRDGSVVAIDPRTGGIYALYSRPSYDPNLLSTHDFNAAKAARAFLNAGDRKPLLAQSYQERYFPGSTFKLVTGTAGLESKKVTVDQPVYPLETSYTPPLTTRPINNFDGERCGGTLPEILRVSCNTAFARMAVDVGPQQMVDTAQAFGFNAPVPIDLPNPAKSFYPSVASFFQDTPKLAQTGFGQNDVQATPLEMAMVAATVANNGVMLVPHLLAEARDSDGAILQRPTPSIWQRPMSAETAAILRDAMIGVVQSGTGTQAQIPGVVVAGKTGTAQVGTNPPSSHAWFVAFAPADNPRVAVAVLVKGVPGVSEVTGGQLAAPIARAIMQAVLSRPDPTVTAKH
ncbi:MAG: cell division protein FtsI/penicillin-binding protein 2 [Acidimicrobiia bacterium]|nr:cell division protein FtsI/penicillin-binding protein 2 [Acidimicrobiia bacterium]